MLAYTLDKLLTQKCTIERDVETADAAGGKRKERREKVAEPRCLFSWWRERSGRSSAREYASPERTIDFTGGTLLLDVGADVEAEDHIGTVFDAEGKVAVTGPLRIVAVMELADHWECALMRP